METFSRTMKEMERYLGSAFRYIYQPGIMTKIPATLPDPEMPTIIPYTGVEFPKTDAEMTYL